MSLKVSLVKILKSDFLSVLFLSIPIVAIVLYVDSAYIGVLHKIFSRDKMSEPGDPMIFLIMAIAVSIIFIPILYFRIKNIANHFRDGIEVPGRINSIYLWKDRGKIAYEYKINGDLFESGNMVHQSKYVNSLIIGQEVAIIVSRKNFKKAYIKDLYV